MLRISSQLQQNIQQSAGPFWVSMLPQLQKKMGRELVGAWESPQIVTQAWLQVKKRGGGRKVEWKHSRVFGKAVIEFMSQRYLSGEVFISQEQACLGILAMLSHWLGVACGKLDFGTNAQMDFRAQQLCLLANYAPYVRHILMATTLGRDLSRKRKQWLQRVLLWVELCLSQIFI